jgi:hypothetical protein
VPYPICATSLVSAFALEPQSLRCSKKPMEHTAGRTFSKCTGSLKEARETRYWLRILHRTHEKERPTIEKLGKEATEIVAILTTIIRKTRAN